LSFSWGWPYWGFGFGFGFGYPYYGPYFGSYYGHYPYYGNYNRYYNNGYYGMRAASPGYSGRRTIETARAAVPLTMGPVSANRRTPVTTDAMRTPTNTNNTSKAAELYKSTTTNPTTSRTSGSYRRIVTTRSGNSGYTPSYNRPANTVRRQPYNESGNYSRGNSQRTSTRAYRSNVNSARGSAPSYNTSRSYTPSRSEGSSGGGRSGGSHSGGGSSGGHRR
jgi:uncharacterized membrane protein YgcG